ncbi:MAG: hypothetical protein AAF432_02055 [Planctomycetota bacterium]
MSAHIIAIKPRGSPGAAVADMAAEAEPHDADVQTDSSASAVSDVDANSTPAAPSSEGQHGVPDADDDPAAAGCTIDTF